MRRLGVGGGFNFGLEAHVSRRSQRGRSATTEREVWPGRMELNFVACKRSRRRRCRCWWRQDR